MAYDTSTIIRFWHEESAGWVYAHVGPAVGEALFSARTLATGDRDRDFNEARRELASMLSEIAQAARSQARYH